MSGLEVCEIAYKSPVLYGLEEDMKVHILTHRWCGNQDEGSEIEAVFADIDKARTVMRTKASENKEQIEKDYNNPKWDDDLTWEAPDAVYMGWYGQGLNPDFSWSWEIDTMQVAE